jgi:uncharacterized membrane protein
MTRLSRDDSGQITTAVVIVGIVVVVWLGLAVTKFGQAVDERSHFQTAADAAALAGAQQIRKQIPELLQTSLDRSGIGSFMSNASDNVLGQDAAADFADRAKAEVTDYHYDPRSDTVTVFVRGRADSVVTGSSLKTTATAKAGVGLILDGCRPPIPPSSPLDISCGDLDIKMGGGDKIDTTAADILGQFATPRLKS